MLAGKLPTCGGYPPAGVAERSGPAGQGRAALVGCGRGVNRAVPGRVLLSAGWLFRGCVRQQGRLMDRAGTACRAALILRRHRAPRAGPAPSPETASAAATRTFLPPTRTAPGASSAASRARQPRPPAAATGTASQPKARVRGQAGNCQPLVRHARLTWLGSKVRIGRVVPVPWMVRPFAYLRFPRLEVSSLRSLPEERSSTRI
jgi:hypothetical protein